MTWVNGHKKLLFCLAVFMIIMMPASAQASQTSGYDQIQMENYPIARRNGVFVDPGATIAVGISADKNNIFASIDFGPWYVNYPWPFNYWYGYDYHSGYQLIIADQILDFTIQDNGNGNKFSVISAGKNIGSGTFSQYYGDTAWQFNLDLKKIKKIIGMDIPENAQLSLQNANLYQGAATISYAGSPTGPWLLAGIGMTIAVGGYFFNSRVRVKKQVNQLTGTTYA